MSGSTTAIVARDFDRETPRPSGAEQSVGFISYGLFVNYWPNPRGGLQFEAVGGIATLWTSEDDEPAFGTDHSLPVGPSFSAGLGLQTWMKPQHSIGAMARFAYAPLFGDWSATVLTPTLSMIVSLH